MGSDAVIEKYAFDKSRFRLVGFLSLVSIIPVGLYIYWVWSGIPGLESFGLALVLILPATVIAQLLFLPSVYSKKSFELTETTLVLGNRSGTRHLSLAEVSHMEVKSFGNLLEIRLTDGTKRSFMYPQDAKRIVTTFNSLKNGSYSNGTARPAVSGQIPAVVTSSPLSIVALVFTFFFPLLGLILGYVAKNEILRSNGRLGGLGLANTAIVLSSTFIGLFFMAAFFWLLLLNG